MELVVVTGLSGAGRRSVLSSLEDSGCTALDNVPARLLEPLLEIETKLNPTRLRLAVGMDNRHPEFAEEFAPLLQHLKASGIPVHVIFLEADDAVLLRRFSESRRPHYLAQGGDVAAAIQQERVLLAPVKLAASAVINTSQLNLSQLRRTISELLPDLPVQGTTLRLVSFGYKHGLPADADIVLDARFLPNPFYVQELRPMTGKDLPVREYLLKSDLFSTFVAMAENWIRWTWPYIEDEGRAYLTVAIGCTGGQHRSVALVESLAQNLRDSVSRLVVQHRELE